MKKIASTVIKILNILILIVGCIYLLLPISELEMSNIADDEKRLELAKYFFTIIEMGSATVLITSLSFFFEPKGKRSILLLFATIAYTAIMLLFCYFLIDLSFIWFILIEIIITLVYIYTTYKVFKDAEVN